jgi:hypothetical protein
LGWAGVGWITIAFGCVCCTCEEWREVILGKGQDEHCHVGEALCTSWCACRAGEPLRQEDPRRFVFFGFSEPDSPRQRQQTITPYSPVSQTSQRTQPSQAELGARCASGPPFRRRWRELSWSSPPNAEPPRGSYPCCEMRPWGARPGLGWLGGLCSGLARRG